MAQQPYPASYHAAMAAVIRCDIMAAPAHMLMVRRKVARALCDVRRAMGRERAVRERHAFYFVGVPLRDWARP